MNNLGAYIQHRWLNPRLPRQTTWDVRPVSAPIWSAPQRAPLGSIFGSALDTASETMAFVKIGVWIVGGGVVGYLAGWLFRELRTANRRKRKRNRRRNPYIREGYGGHGVYGTEQEARGAAERLAGRTKSWQKIWHDTGSRSDLVGQYTYTKKGVTRRRNSSSKRTFAIGDRVGYARQFLKNIGLGPTAEEWGWKGTIVDRDRGGLSADRFSTVRFDHGYEVMVNNMNLAKIGSRAYVD